MSVLSYPDVREYTLPEKNVLVISCIDLRLTDNLLHFLHHDNLANRYDHFALAGVSLSAFATTDHKKLFKKDMLNSFSFQSWKKSLDEHLQIAVALHDIRDVYIVEHASCGAYKTFLKDGNFPSLEEEVKGHTFFATALSKEIAAKKYNDGKPYHLHVHSFMIDLRGNVRLLHTTNKPA